MAVVLEDALKAIAAAHDTARKVGAQVTAAVVDPGGHLVALSRMDRARPLSVRIAEAKAAGAVLMHRDGESLARIAQERPDFFQALNDLSETPLIPSAGSLLITRGDEVIGAIGVSGGTSDQDLECARAGVEALAPDS